MILDFRCYIFPQNKRKKLFFAGILVKVIFTHIRRQRNKSGSHKTENSFDIFHLSFGYESNCKDLTVIKLYKKSLGKIKKIL